ncbi:MAG: bifunctional UDP-N-acetylglucosamine diphosphorylase/glucosamine-1-phosphate N-acetyltransferase GlmU [Myxococcales bacterium]|nr:bifunctional UDP-N-acetylglucosamine diphosphorylase/glucosamine-1-phosphate N-acetyltransferase GlmU [Myxococcales bacterium]
MSKLTAIVLAAGKGTRMKSKLPKVLHEVLGKPMVTYPVRAAVDAGASSVVVVVGYGREAVESALRAEFPELDMRFAVQAEQKGTGHAVMTALPFVEGGCERVLILNGDLPNLSAATIAELIHVAEQDNSIAALLTARVEDPTGLGRILRDSLGRVLQIVEESDASPLQRAIQEINVGSYLFRRSYLDGALITLSSGNAQGEFYLTDLFGRAASMEEFPSALVVEDLVQVTGVNNRSELSKAEDCARRRRNEQLMVSGVTMRDPNTTWVETGSQVAADVVLGPGVMIRGRSSIAEDCIIEAGAILQDVQVGRGTTIAPYSHLDGCTIGEDCTVGPFARLRPAAVLHDKVKVGNFVEVKKSTLGKGTKAGHLTYLGDATIGEGVNVGAGTITCNYDGKHKHVTVLGDGVFVGSNTELVAPVSVGARAFIGAGSTITENVPERALALGRARQRNIEGYVPEDDSGE